MRRAMTAREDCRQLFLAMLSSKTWSRNRLRDIDVVQKALPSLEVARRGLAGVGSDLFEQQRR